MRQCERGVHYAVAMTAALLAIAGSAVAAVPEKPPTITARSAVILDGTTGAIIWQRDADRQMPPASTTKIMTTLLALESKRLDRSFRVSALAASQAPSKLGLRAGQSVGLDDLTYALMLKSANDAAVVVAEGLAGSVPEFAALMNARAREIGATNTQFHNPNGLPDPEHLTTTHDMALILRYALTVPGFREVAGTSGKVIQVEDSKIHPIALHSKNRLLDGYFVPVLGKTGYTRAAGQVLRRSRGAERPPDHHRRVRRHRHVGRHPPPDGVRLLDLRRYRSGGPARPRGGPSDAADQPSRRASKRRARTTSVASRSSKRAPAKVASEQSPQASKSAKSVARAKATAQAAARTRSATVAASAQRSASRSAAVAAKSKSPDQQAKLDTATVRTRR